jgi:hypothetical protein
MSAAPRRRGRPPLDPSDPSVGVYSTLPGKQYDALYGLASRSRVTLSELVRRTLQQLLRKADRSSDERT